MNWRRPSHSVGVSVSTPECSAVRVRNEESPGGRSHPPIRHRRSSLHVRYYCVTLKLMQVGVTLRGCDERALAAWRPQHRGGGAVPNGPLGVLLDGDDLYLPARARGLRGHVAVSPGAAWRRGGQRPHASRQPAAGRERVRLRD
ncbi:hypothetical protein ON010_g9157 [Phytophthora cinnamomi]|nr:hypothetical protein ON010_g9157 [Phytophthora cinnamomi]